MQFFRTIPMLAVIFLLFHVALFAVPTAALQEPTSISVREALRDEDGDRIPDRLGESVKLIGVLTSDPIVVGRAASFANLQDSTGGIRLFTRDVSLVAGHFHRGDLVEVQGKVGQFKGTKELLIEEIKRLGSVPVPAPRDVFAIELQGERYSGQIVRLAGQLVIPPDLLARKRGAVLRDASGEIPVVVSDRWFQDLTFTERLMKGGKVEITGIAGQYKEQAPFDSGYRLIPRDAADFRFAPRPPYAAMVLGTTLIVFLAGMVFLWLRRRTAERRMRETARLMGILRRSEEKFAKAFSSCPDAIGIGTLAEGRIMDVNQSFLDMIGYRREEVIGHTVGELNIWSDPEARQRMVQTLRSQGNVRSMEMQFRMKSGRIRDGLFSAEIINLGGEECLLGVTRDVTEAKRLGEELRQAQKMESIGRLAGGVAHDFNNLLLVIRGHCELLVDRLSPADPLHRNAGEIQKAADRAASLTQQLLAFSRKQVLEPKVLDLNAVVADAENMLIRLIGEHIELVTVLRRDLGHVKADVGQTALIIMNLALNARDAMPNGGKLTIETSNVDLDGSISEQNGSAIAGRYVVLAVSDTGTGMDAETQARIFEPFFTTKGLGKGTGLGLATVYGIVKQSNGSIAVHSEPGKGTSFRVYLPRVEEAIRVDADTAVTAAPAGIETILVVEDDGGVRDVVREQLEWFGYTVLVAGSGAEAVQLSERHAGMIHLMITDVVMPGLGGRELAERLAPQRPKMKVLYVSGHTDDAVVRYGVSHRGMAFLQKPFAKEALGRKVQEVLGVKDRMELEPIRDAGTRSF